ncbi:hypothetical protein TNCV_144481 [Trichonephila clavipes]|nr:hypothetical protein TNCV_144481 [Trichonephila clavipes]
MALYRSPLTVTLWPSSFLKKYGLIPPAHKAHQTWQQALATDTLSSYTHDYPTLPADVAEAIYPIYEGFRNVKLLESALGHSLGIAAHGYVDKEDAERMGAREKEEWRDDNTS